MTSRIDFHAAGVARTSNELVSSNADTPTSTPSTRRLTRPLPLRLLGRAAPSPLPEPTAAEDVLFLSSTPPSRISVESSPASATLIRRPPAHCRCRIPRPGGRPGRARLMYFTRRRTGGRRRCRLRCGRSTAPDIVQVVRLAGDHHHRVGAVQRHEAEHAGDRGLAGLAEHPLQVLHHLAGAPDCSGNTPTDMLAIQSTSNTWMVRR